MERVDEGVGVSLTAPAAAVPAPTSVGTAVPHHPNATDLPRTGADLLLSAQLAVLLLVLGAALVAAASHRRPGGPRT